MLVASGLQVAHVIRRFAGFSQPVDAFFRHVCHFCVGWWLGSRLHYFASSYEMVSGNGYRFRISLFTVFLTYVSIRYYSTTRRPRSIQLPKISFSHVSAPCNITLT